jgi:hypothetical protein
MGGGALVDVTAWVNDEPNESVREVNAKEAPPTTTPTSITSPLATLLVKETESELEQPRHPPLFCCTSAEAACTGNNATANRSVAEIPNSVKRTGFLSMRHTFQGRRRLENNYFFVLPE